MSIAIFSSLLCLPPTFFVFLSNQCQKLNSVLDDKTRASIPCINTMHPNQIQLYRNNMKTYECLLKATLINIVQSLEKVQEVVKKLESWKVQKNWLKMHFGCTLLAPVSVSAVCLPTIKLRKIRQIQTCFWTGMSLKSLSYSTGVSCWYRRCVSRCILSGLRIMIM